MNRWRDFAPMKPRQPLQEEQYPFLPSQNVKCKSPSDRKILGKHFFTTLCIVQAVFLGISVSLLLRRSSQADLTCARRLSPYSPYLIDSDLEYQEITDQNQFAQPSIYRGAPTEELETAWEDLRIGAVAFPEEYLVRLNKSSPEIYAHTATGEVMGYFDVFHQLHCLNFIRQYTYRDVYDYSHVVAFRAPDLVVRAHVDHCIETLRKVLTCASDVTPLVFITDETRPEGMRMDFNVRRKCRNFEKVQEWSRRNRIQ